MLTIRAGQMEAFDRATESGFIRRMLDHLHEGFVEYVVGLTDEDLSDMIRSGIHQAAGFGIQRECDVCRFIEYLTMYGPEFLEQSWAATILSSQELSAADKLDRIDDYEQFADL